MTEPCLAGHSSSVRLPPLDAAEAPQIVLEQPAPCSDGAKAEAMLRRALAPSVAPRVGWMVTVRMARSGGHLTAEGEITDEAEALVAHRAIKQDTHECAALARAVGVWASLVLDAEVERAAAAPPPPPPAPAPVPGTETWPAPVVHEKHAPEAPLFLNHGLSTDRTVEIGVTSFLMGGTGSGMVAGPSLFSVLEAGRGWFLRPMLAVGRTIEELKPSSDVYATWGAARFDACGRIPGYYLERRGIQLDMCGGAELGFLLVDAPSSVPAAAQAPPQNGTGRTVPLFAVGPSLGLRGELGGDLSAMVRGVAEVNVIRESFTDSTGTTVDPRLFVGRAEVGLSWRLR